MKHRKVHTIFDFINNHNAIAGGEKAYSLSNRITPPPNE